MSNVSPPPFARSLGIPTPLASHVYRVHVTARRIMLLFLKAHTLTRLFLLAVCDNYLCPDTLACVHFPHHCPCAWDDNEEKFEMGEGKRVCISKGGFKPGEAARKIELARKGLL